MHSNHSDSYLVFEEHYSPQYDGRIYKLFVPDLAVARAKRTVFEQVIDRVVEVIAERYIKIHEMDILKEIDPKTVAKLAQVKMAKTVWDR